MYYYRLFVMLAGDRITVYAIAYDIKWRSSFDNTVEIINHVR